MGGGGGRKGGRARKAGKRAGGAARRAGAGARRAGRRAGHRGGRIGRRCTRGVSRHSRAGIRATRRGIRSTYRASSRMAARSHGMHFRMPGIKIRKFTSIRSRMPKMNFTSNGVHYSRHRRRHHGTHYDDPYYHNSSLGYHCYDDVNSYNHRRYARIHRYKPLVRKDTELVSYDSMRMSLPPDSPNFCFIPLTSLSMCGTPDELEAIKSDHFDVTAKVIALMTRPYSVDQTPMSVLYSTVKELVNQSGILLRGMEDPEDSWYVPDFLCYGCLVGKSKQQRMDEFSEQEMEETADEIVVLWNKNPKFAARGMSISFVDIGNSFCGFALEVLPFINVPTAHPSTNPLQDAKSAPESNVPTVTMVTNPHFFVVPTAPPVSLSSTEMKTIGLVSQTARGDRVQEEEYDAAFTAAAEEFNSQGEIVRTEGEEGTEGYSSFLVVVPDGALAGGLITVLSPEGVLYSVSVPEGAPPGSSLLVSPGTIEQSDVVATPYTPAPSDAPPSYAQSFYHSNVIDENDTSVPPPYSGPGQNVLPLPVFCSPEPIVPVASTTVPVPE